MLCEECHLRDATIHYQETINDNYNEIHLCEECARKKGLDALHVLPSLGLANLLAGLAELDEKLIHKKEIVRKCENVDSPILNSKRREELDATIVIGHSHPN